MQQVALLAFCIISLSCAEAYAGFDCGQGSAILQLASHTCASEVHQRYLSCFRSLALRVSHCSIKAWPHPHQGRKQGCGSLQLVANVTDVNQAHGTLHLHGGPKHSAVPVHLEYSRRDEAMHLRLSAPDAAPESCLLLFDAVTASDASLHPVPGEDTRSVASLLAVLVPALLVPCALVGLFVAVGGMMRAGANTAWHKPSSRGDGYTLLDAGPGDASSGVQPGDNGTHSHVASSSKTVGLGILKVMSRRARAKRMRRSCRPAYVGLPEQSAQQHRAYVAGRLQPGPFHLVAPFFKFPPVAMPPPLEAIPESVTPTTSSASRASSSQDLSGASVDLSRASPVIDVDDAAVLQPDHIATADMLISGSSSRSSSSSSVANTAGSAGLQQPVFDVLVRTPVPGWAWMAPTVSDTEEGGTASS